LGGFKHAYRFASGPGDLWQLVRPKYDKHQKDNHGEFKAADPKHRFTLNQSGATSNYGQCTGCARGQLKNVPGKHNNAF